MYRREDLTSWLTSREEQKLSESIFYPNLCKICFSHDSESPLNCCEGCRMVWYCSKDHQEQDWRQHKRFCKEISYFLETTKKSNIFDAIFELKFKPTTFEEAKWFICDYMLTARIDLSPSEFQMIYFPKSCEVCKIAEPSLLISCNNCPQASFCNRHFGDAKHKELCDLYTIGCFLDSRELFKFKDPEFSAIESKCLPGSMKEFMNSPEITDYERLKSSTLFSLSLSHSLTNVLTLLYSIRKMNFSENQDLVIHVIDEEARIVHSWQLILKFLPHVETIKIILVHPNKFLLEETCFTFTKVEKERKIDFEIREFCSFKGYMKKDFIQPNIVVGFDLGKEFLKFCPGFVIALKNLNCPFLLSSSSKKDARYLHKRLKNVFDSDEENFYIERNPFSSLRPYRSESEGISYMNAYNNVFNENSYEEDVSLLEESESAKIDYYASLIRDSSPETNSWSLSSSDNNLYDEGSSSSPRPPSVPDIRDYHRNVMEHNALLKEKYKGLIYRKERYASYFEEIRQGCLVDIESLKQALQQMEGRVVKVWIFLYKLHRIKN